MKNIVVLDAHTLSPLQPGEHSPFHPNWDAIAALGPLQLYPRSKPDEIVARARNAQILLTNKAVVSAEQINALPELEYIGVMATGYNVVDLDAARARGIPVTNIPGYGTASVAQHVFALLLELTARVGATDAAVKNGDWVRCPDFCFTVAPFVELAGKTLGIVGYGTIGQAVARIASAFGMRILATARTPKPSEVPVEWVSLDELFRQSDVITLHCPLTDETRHVINRDNLAKMKASAFLINTGRGPLIDEEALAAALKDGVIAGFGGDVLSAEPPPRTNPLLTAPRTIITPHIAWASVEARTRLMGTLARNILDFLAGSPVNVVNGPAAASAAVAAAQEPAPVQPAGGETAFQEPAPEEPATLEAEEVASTSPEAPVSELPLPSGNEVPAPEVEPEIAPAEPDGDSGSPDGPPPEPALAPADEPLSEAPVVSEAAENDGAIAELSEEVLSFDAASEIPPAEPVSDLIPVEPSAQESVPPEPAPFRTTAEPVWQEHGQPEPSFAEPAAPLPQEAIAEALAAVGSTTPETNAEFAIEETNSAQSFEAVPADTISQESVEIVPPNVAGPTETPLPVPQETSPDPIAQEAIAETLAATDSTTPETGPEFATREESSPSSPEAAADDTLLGESLETAPDEPVHDLPSSAPAAESHSETEKSDRPPQSW